MDKKEVLGKSFAALTLLFFYSTFCMTDIDCENAQQDYEIKACESIASRLGVQKFNIEIFIYLKMSHQSINQFSSSSFCHLSAKIQT